MFLYAYSDNRSCSVLSIKDNFKFYVCFVVSFLIQIYNLKQQQKKTHIRYVFNGMSYTASVSCYTSYFYYDNTLRHITHEILWINVFFWLWYYDKWNELCVKRFFFFVFLFGMWMRARVCVCVCIFLHVVFFCFVCICSVFWIETVSNLFQIIIFTYMHMSHTFLIHSSSLHIICTTFCLPFFGYLATLLFSHNFFFFGSGVLLN